MRRRSLHAQGLTSNPAGGAEHPAGMRRFAVVEHFLDLDKGPLDLDWARQCDSPHGSASGIPIFVWGGVWRVYAVGPHRDVGHVPQVGPGTIDSTGNACGGGRRYSAYQPVSVYGNRPTL